MVGQKVRVGKVYRVRLILFDQLMFEHYTATEGQMVRVVNLYGCPPANTMGMCHIEDAESGEFLGMVCTNSLERVE